MNTRLVVLGLVLHFFDAFADRPATVAEYIYMSPLTGIAPVAMLAAGHCPGTKVPTECEKLKPVADRKDSYCCPTCDLLWSPTMSAYMEVVSDPTPANVYLASMRTAQLVALAAAGAAGAVPLFGDVVANPANAMVTGLDMLLPEHMSPEVQCMREQFAKTQEHMVKMEERIRQDIENLAKKVEAQNFYAQYMAIRQKKKVLEDALKFLMFTVDEGHCTHENRHNCDAIISWLDHCKFIHASNQHDPQQLISELKNLVSGTFLGQTFLGAATSADNTIKHFMEIYMAINNDVLEIVMLNTKCAATLNNTKSNYNASVQFVDKQVKEIKNHLMRIINERVQKELTEQTAKLVRETKQYNNWNDLLRDLKNKEKTTHSSLLLLRKAKPLRDTFPFFRTYCLLMDYSHNEQARQEYEAYAVPTNLSGDTETNVIFNETVYIHLTDHRHPRDPNHEAFLCYTHVPADAQSALNDIEFRMCQKQHHSGTPTSRLCDKWQKQVKVTTQIDWD